MKIAILNIYNGRVERGAEIFVEELADMLSRNHDINVFQTGEKKNNRYKIHQISDIPYFPHQAAIDQSFTLKRSVNAQLYNFWLLIFSIKCLPYLWRGRYDWIIPINGRWQVILCRLLRFFSRGKILISGHAGIGFDDKFNLIIGRPDVFVALTPDAFTWAKKNYSEKQIMCIPNGVNIEKFNPDVIPAKIPIRKPIVLCVSALLHYKRIHLLIQAVAKLLDVSLLIIGDGPLKGQIDNLGRNLLGDRFHLIPYVPHKDMASYYTACQIFSLPSKSNEAFGLVYLEALACSLPVVAPDDINRRNIIGEAGLFCNVSNINEYSETLWKAVESDFFYKPRKQAEKFSWQKIAQNYEKIMER